LALQLELLLARFCQKSQPLKQLPAEFIRAAIIDIPTKFTNICASLGKEVFENHHPLHASNEHNFLFYLGRL
jgi:hypothetical protein